MQTKNPYAFLCVILAGHVSRNVPEYLITHHITKENAYRKILIFSPLGKVVVEFTVQFESALIAT